MKRLCAFLVLPLLMLAGCGAIIVGGTLNGGNAVVASGVVSVVRLTFASEGNGASITVTVVTLSQSGSAQDFTFCGSQGSQFPMDRFVTTRFTAGTTCSTLLSVTAGP